MRAVVYDRPESFTIRELPIPEPGPGEVRLRGPGGWRVRLGPLPSSSWPVVADSTVVKAALLP